MTETVDLTKASPSESPEDILEILTSTGWLLDLREKAPDNPVAFAIITGIWAGARRLIAAGMSESVAAGEATRTIYRLAAAIPKVDDPTAEPGWQTLVDKLRDDIAWSIANPR